MNVRLKLLSGIVALGLLIAALPATFSSQAAGMLAAGPTSGPGPVYGWGLDNYRQVGVDAGKSGVVTSPVAVRLPDGSGLNFTGVAGGDYHSLALGSDGRVYTWGYNDSGQLGNDAVNQSGSPVVQAALPEGLSFTALAGGGFHSLAVGSDGKIYAWGYNSSGQLGLGSLPDSNRHPVPAPVVNLPAGVTFTALAGSYAHSLALGSDGRIYGWGNNHNWQLGVSTAPDYYTTTPVTVTPPAGTDSSFKFTAVSTGLYHSLALANDGKLYAWGENSSGQLGDGTFTNRLTPVAVQFPGGVGASFAYIAVAAGQYHSLAVGNDGKVYSWGGNQYGQLGTGGTGFHPTPEEVLNLPAGVTFTSVSAGQYHSLALGSDGKIYAWGYNRDGELGDGSTTGHSSPVAVNPPAGVSFTRVSAGLYHTLALTTLPACQPFVVTQPNDDGSGQACGTLSYVLAQPGGSAGAPVTITFALTGSGTITFTGSLSRSVKPYVTIDGSGGPGGSITLNGNLVSGDGLQLGGNDILSNLVVQHFNGRQITTLGQGNRLDRVKANC